MQQRRANAGDGDVRNFVFGAIWGRRRATASGDAARIRSVAGFVTLSEREATRYVSKLVRLFISLMITPFL
jgi:hypothetical protein